MENRESFMARFRPIWAPRYVHRIEAAYMFAKYLHRAQNRKTGPGGAEPERYFEHCRRTALIAFDELGWREQEPLIACLLHDTLEDSTEITPEMMETMFGADVTCYVRMVTKDPKEGYLERLSRTRDFRPVLIKLCDRLDNLRSLGHCEEAFRRKQALETREKYLPLFRGILSAHSPYDMSADIQKCIAESESIVSGILGPEPTLT